MKVRLGSLIAVALVSLAACGDDGESPTDVTRAYLGAIAEGDGKRACGLMTDDFKRGLTDNYQTANTVRIESDERTPLHGDFAMSTVSGGSKVA